jgi:aspartate/methionine/tyrosine aminotransferase
MFPRLDPAVYPIADDRQFFLELLQETKVMLVQGTGFNYPDNRPLPHRVSCRMKTTCAKPLAASPSSWSTTASARPEL